MARPFPNAPSANFDTLISFEFSFSFSLGFHYQVTKIDYHYILNWRLVPKLRVFFPIHKHVYHKSTVL